jgi:hypothetical protein
MRSRWSLLALAAILAAPAAANAASADLFAQFQRACVEANARPAAVAAAAKGWSQHEAGNGRAVWSKGDYRLTSAVQRIDRGERRTCSISGPADPAAAAKARAWAGAGPTTNNGAVATYRVLDAARDARPATAEDALDPDKAGRVSGLAVSTEGNVTTLGLATFWIDPSKLSGADRLTWPNNPTAMSISLPTPADFHPMARR